MKFGKRLHPVAKQRKSRTELLFSNARLCRLTYQWPNLLDIRPGTLPQLSLSASILESVYVRLPSFIQVYTNASVERLCHPHSPLHEAFSFIEDHASPVAREGQGGWKARFERHQSGSAPSVVRWCCANTGTCGGRGAKIQLKSVSTFLSLLTPSIQHRAFFF